MKWFKKKAEPEKVSEEQSEARPENPLIVMQLVDGIHLEVAVEWPEKCDIKPFAHFLALLTSGQITGPLVAASAMFATRVGEPEKALLIHAAIDKNVVKKRSDRPLILPSKVIPNQIKTHGH